MDAVQGVTEARGASRDEITAPGRIHETRSHRAPASWPGTWARWGGTSARARDVNQRGVVVGLSRTAAGDLHGFRWFRGRMEDLGPLAGKTSLARAVDRNGRIAGASTVAGGELPPPPA